MLYRAEARAKMEVELAGVKDSMPRFVAVDGLRAWMAWLVVAAHLVQLSGLENGGRAWHTVFLSGNWGVQTFIIISGFVIAHLLIERRETYSSFIVRRFARLFPAFAFCCMLGGFAFIVESRIGSDAWFGALGELYDSQTRYLPWHLLTHLMMLHGLVPNNILPQSEYIFNPPGWSVSLEWQFYLIAPMLLRLARSRTIWILASLVLIAMFGYHHWLHSFWGQPSIIIGTSQYFLIGIVSRMAAPRLANLVTGPFALAIIAVAFGFWLDCVSIAIWLAVFGMMMADRSGLSGIEAGFVGVMRSLLESVPVQYLAQRSYSTYLLHWPVMMTIGAAATAMGIPVGPRLALVLLITFPVTAVLQIATYRWIEQPGQRLGSRWARRLGEQPIREVAVP